MINRQNDSTRANSRRALQNIRQISNRWTVGKLRPARKNFYHEPIKNRILERFPAAARESLLTAGELIHLKAQENIHRAEERTEFIYFPETVVISEYQILEDGKTVEIAMTGNEGMVGVETFFNSRPLFPNWLNTSLAGSALRVNAASLLQIFDIFPRVRQLIFEAAGLHIGQITQKVICSAHHFLEERLCSWLLMLNDCGGRASLSVTQEQIACALGVHRPSVTLIMQSLRERKIIDYVRGKIFLLDRQLLENSVCSCYRAAKKY